ncbi:MAG: FtsX-like permease family protein [Gammaproteobacteria bacterium]
MNSVLSRAGRNFLWRHPWQLAMAILGIALGVAVVISIHLALESSLNAFERASRAFSGEASHRIMTPDGGVDEKLYRQLRVEQGIGEIAPVVKGRVHLSNQTDSGFNLIGIDPFIEQSFRPVWQQRERGNQLDDRLIGLISVPDAALISKLTARRLNLKRGDELAVETQQGERRLKIAGLLTAENEVSEEMLSHMIITDIAAAQEILGFYGLLSAIDVLTEGEQPEKLNKIRSVLPDTVLLVSVESQSEAMREMTRAFAINLKALGLLSLLVGMFLIYNTMTFLVMQRRRLIGSLRAIGVTRREIFAMILAEAMMLALIGTVVGIGLGVALGKGLLQLISGTINAFYFRLDAAPLLVDPALIGKGAVLGFAATLLAVLPPAIEATRFSPVRIMIRSQLEYGVRRVIKAVGLISVVFILGGLALSFFSGRSIEWGLTGIFLLIFGFALLTPQMTLLLMNLIERVFGRFMGALARLPARMVSAEISRTGIAIAALMIAVSATIGMDLMIGSFRQTVGDWLKTTLRADLYVSLPGEKMPGDNAREEHRLKTGLKGLQGVQTLSSVLYTKMIADGRVTKASVFEVIEKSKTGFIFKGKTEPDVWTKFQQQPAVLVTEPYAYHNDVSIGRKIQLQTGQGLKAFEVIGIYADYSGDQGHLALSRQNYRNYWPDVGFSGIGVYAEDGVDIGLLKNEIEKLLTGQQSVQSDQAIYNASMALFEDTFAVTEALRWLSAIIAFAGVFGALMALQFERTRQLGILRAIGVTPGQLAALIIGETGLIGWIAGMLAVPVGYLVAYVLIYVVYQRSFGWTLAFYVNPGVAGQGMALAIAAATLAGIVPALKMAKTRPIEALRTE